MAGCSPLGRLKNEWPIARMAHRLVLRGKDYEYDSTSGGTLSNFKN